MALLWHYSVFYDYFGVYVQLRMQFRRMLFGLDEGLGPEMGFLSVGSKFYLLVQLYLSCLMIVLSSKILTEWPCAV